MEILKQIERVDHNDVRAMFKLNELVYEWLVTINPEVPYGEFVFSRDALKAIRPEGWTYSSYQNRPETEWGYKQGWRVSMGTACKSPILPTEELAELHAIISAIQYERSNA